MRRLLLIALGIAALVAAGCSSAAGDPAPPAASAPEPAPRAAAAAPAPRPTGTVIRIGRSQFGPILFDRRGQAIYLFAIERRWRSRCYGACAAAWPPVLTKGRPRAGSGVRARLLGTTRRRDGKLQVTYRGHPLYYYVNEGRNEVRCHNVYSYGGLWKVLNRAGNPLP